jgi:hypothetical protein
MYILYICTCMWTFFPISSFCISNSCLRITKCPSTVWDLATALYPYFALTTSFCLEIYTFTLIKQTDFIGAVFTLRGACSLHSERVARWLDGDTYCVLILHLIIPCFIGRWFAIIIRFSQRSCISFFVSSLWLGHTSGFFQVVPLDFLIFYCDWGCG